MKRTKKTKPSNRTSGDPLLYYFMEAFAQSAAARDAAVMVDIVYKRVIETGEPISPDLKQWLANQLHGGPASKLLDAVPVVRNAKKRAATLKKSHIQAAEKKKRAVLDIAERLRLEDRRRGVPGRIKHLAGLVYKELPQPESAKDDKRPSVRTIRHWISEARKK
jgi:hypothetical protein